MNMPFNGRHLHSVKPETELHGQNSIDKYFIDGTRAPLTPVLS